MLVFNFLLFVSSCACATLLKKICLVVSILLRICTILNRNVQSKKYTLNQEAACINLSGGIQLVQLL